MVWLQCWGKPLNNQNQRKHAPTLTNKPLKMLSASKGNSSAKEFATAHGVSADECNCYQCETTVLIRKVSGLAFAGHLQDQQQSKADILFRLIQRTKSAHSELKPHHQSGHSFSHCEAVSAMWCYDCSLSSKGGVEAFGSRAPSICYSYMAVSQIGVAQNRFPVLPSLSSVKSGSCRTSCHTVWPQNLKNSTTNTHVFFLRPADASTNLDVVPGHSAGVENWHWARDFIQMHPNIYLQ